MSKNNNQLTTAPGFSGPVMGGAAKAKNDARAAIALFVNRNAVRLQDWLDAVAHGVPKIDEYGRVALNEHGQVEYDVKPNPEKAFSLFQSVIEYHIPKLARKEIVGNDGGAVNIDMKTFRNLPDSKLSQLENILLESGVSIDESE
jgi:hypothetical protein